MPCVSAKSTATTLAGALLVNKSLSNLNLGNNNIGVAGATALLTALKDCNTTLWSINLDKNKVSASSKRQIYEIASLNRRRSHNDLARDVQANREATHSAKDQDKEVEEEQKERTRSQHQDEVPTSNEHCYYLAKQRGEVVAIAKVEKDERERLQCTEKYMYL